MLCDRFNRPINYLRISITDRCNFRCVYCMPPQGVVWRDHAEMLTYEEITEITKVAVREGVTRVRLTGGEPLVRKNLPELVRSLAAIPGLEDISLTTNATLLEELAEPLARAGLNRVNVSLDTLDAAKFTRITRGGSLEKALRGIQAAETAGLKPIKLNAVVVRGVNDDELVSLARLTLEHEWQVRFIELMPVSNLEDWGFGFPQAGDRYVSVQEMHTRLAPLELVPADEQNGNGPSRNFRIPGAKATVGFISPMGEHFCASCNRLRLTADGNLRPCLLHDIEVPIREALRAGEDILPYLKQALELKPEGHENAVTEFHTNRRMAQIGG